MGRGREKTAVLVPVKPFGQAKTRLAPLYSSAEREALARDMLRTVIKSAKGLRVAIVSSQSAQDVRRLALINGARFLAEPDGAGLDLAVRSGVAQLANRDYDRVVVVHSDLPRVRDITWLADTDGVIVVPDRTGRGTNAISLPARCGFRFSFGPDSFARHMEEAQRLGIDASSVVDLNGVSADVDEPADLDNLDVPRDSSPALKGHVALWAPKARGH